MLWRWIMFSSRSYKAICVEGYNSKKTSTELGKTTSKGGIIKERRMMFKKSIMVAVLSIFLLGGIVFAGNQDNQLNELVNQLNAKTCKYEVQGSAFITRSLFASFLR